MSDHPRFSLERSDFRDRVVAFVHDLQDDICRNVEQVDGSGTFSEDRWEREGGGGGLTRVIADGTVFEKGGVNTSVVFGNVPDHMAQLMNTGARQFFATGLSLVLHPHSPLIPTVHANFRYFLNDDGDEWFGGGLDLTPFTADELPPTHFHTVLREVCDGHNEGFYPQFKQECDRYFYLPHRGEARGVGGIFYDYLRGSNAEMDAYFAFHKDAGRAFVPAYVPIVEKYKGLEASDRQKAFQLLRRGRYVEFNLIYDRGTRFGLETGGRTESILMSLPPVCTFEYSADMMQSEDERQLQDWLHQPRGWA